MKPFSWPKQVSRVGALSLAGVILVVGGLETSAQRGRPIEFSQPKGSGSTASTNLQQLTAKQLRDDLLQQKLRDDLLKSLENASRGSLDGLMVPPTPGSDVAAPPTAAQRKRTREQFERRKYWLFLSQEELAQDGRLGEFMNALGDEQDPALAGLLPIERFYLRLAGNSLTATNDARRGLNREFGFTNGTDRAFAEPEALGKRFQAGRAPDSRAEPPSAAGSLIQQGSLVADLFKVEPNSPLAAITLPELMPPLNTPPPADLGAQTLRRQQFQQLLESPGSFLSDPLQGLTPRVEPNRPVTPVSNVDRALESVAQSARLPAFSPPAAAPSPASELLAPPGANSGLLSAGGSPSFSAPPPRVAPVTTPPQMILPRRAF